MEIILFDHKFEHELSAHLVRHWAESGRDGPHFLPFDLNQSSQPNGVDPDACEKPFDEYGWQRWLVVLVDNNIRGHCSLKSDGLRTGMHRCELGIGLEVDIRNMGIGSALLATAIDVAKAAETIEWMDLHVLDGNQHAIELYKKFGFKTVAAVKDRFRIQGESLNDVIMALQLADYP